MIHQYSGSARAQIDFHITGAIVVLDNNIASYAFVKLIIVYLKGIKFREYLISRFLSAPNLQML